MKKLLFKTILVAAAMCVGMNAWGDGTVQALGNNTTKTFTFTASQTEILSGSTLTFDGLVMTFMGTNNTWSWNASNKGMLGINTPGNASDSYYSTWSTSNGIPAYGSVYKFEASANGIVYLGGKAAGTKYYVVKDVAGTLTVIKEVSASAGWADIRFEMKSGETYYFFQLGSSLNGGRYTLTKVSFTKWSDISLTAVSEPTTWNYAALKAAQDNLGLSTDDSIWVKNMTDDKANRRLKFQTTLDSNPTGLGDDMVVFKAGVAGQVYMRLVDYTTTVSIYDGTNIINFVGSESGEGTSQKNAGYHGGNTFYKYATFQVEANKQYYIYRTEAHGGSPNAGVYFIDFQPTGTNITTALTEEATWNYGTQKDILTEFHGVTKDNMYYSDGLTAALNGSSYRLLFGATGSTSSRYMSFKLPANVCGKVTVTPSCGTGETVVLSDGTSVLNTFSSSDDNVAVEVPVTTTAATTLYLYATNNDALTAGIRSISWTPVTSVTATIGPNSYTTFSSAYPLALGSMTASEGEVIAYYVTSVQPDKAILGRISENVEAGEGLILRGTPNATITIPVAASGDAITNHLVGCPTATELTTPNSNYYVMVNSGAGVEFQVLDGSYTDNKVTIPAGKAYLNVAAAGARLSVVFDDETTGVQELKNSRIEGLKTGNYYNLSGQRVAMPAKGLYIVNGKKVLVK